MCKLLFESLSKFWIKLPKCPAYSKHVYHIYAVEGSNEKKIQDSLNEVNIDIAIHYPNILPNTDIYKEEKL